MANEKHKTLVLVVAYAASAHIEKVLKRIETSVAALPDLDIHTLVIDDGSPDNTAALAERFKATTSMAMTVLRNPVNQGYGGNQKLGYRYALRFGFDSVVMVHGDGQYPPEQIGAMVEKIIAEKAEVVLGSRMLNRRDAIKGGMPYYKFVGNIILTGVQNWMLGMRLSEFHTGFRAYSKSFLQRTPFAYNSNDFDFDTDILIQARLSKANIAEISIPTHYGDEVCHVNGTKYAVQILRTSILANMQRYQIYYHPKFDFAPDAPYASKVGIDSSHDFAIRNVLPYQNVLDIGGCAGHVARVLRKEKGCFVYGVDTYQHRSSAEEYDQLTHADIDREDMKKYLPVDRPIQTVLLLDVLEQLEAPEYFLTSLREQLRMEQGRMIITTANVGFILTRLSLMLGHFNYSKRGILDFTHKRLFTLGSLRRMLVQHGYKIDRIEGIPIPFGLIWPNHPRRVRLLTGLNRQLIRISRRLFSYQIGMVVHPLPTLDVLLENAEKSFDHP